MDGAELKLIEELKDLEIIGSDDERRIKLHEVFLKLVSFTEKGSIDEISTIDLLNFLQGLISKVRDDPELLLLFSKIIFAIYNQHKSNDQFIYTHYYRFYINVGSVYFKNLSYEASFQDMTDDSWLNLVDYLKTSYNDSTNNKAFVVTNLLLCYNFLSNGNEGLTERILINLVEIFNDEMDVEVLLLLYHFSIDSIDKSTKNQINLANALTKSITISNTTIKSEEYEDDLEDVEYELIKNSSNESEFKASASALLLGYLTLHVITSKDTNVKLNSAYIFSLALDAISFSSSNHARAILFNVLSMIRFYSDLDTSTPIPDITSLKYDIFVLSQGNQNKAFLTEFVPKWYHDNDYCFDLVQNLPSLFPSINQSTTDLELLNSYGLPINRYLLLLIKVLEKDIDFGVIMTVLLKFPSQLVNRVLFLNFSVSLIRLRNCICSWIVNNKILNQIKSLPKPNNVLPDPFKFGDVYLLAYRILHGLVSYRFCFTKAERDGIVLAFQTGLSRWSVTARSCLHALSVCCYELPQSMTKLLSGTLIQLSQIMSTASISVHILEFLSSLAQLPKIYANLIEEDFKRIFSIALQYIQNTNRKSPNTNTVTTSNLGKPSFALDQYVLTLAYHVISVWFVSLRFTDRRKYIPFIVRGLQLASNNLNNPDEHVSCCLDMLSRFAFSTCPAPTLPKIQVTSPKFATKTWLRRETLISVASLASDELSNITDESIFSIITVRRPCSTSSFITNIPNHLVKKGSLIDEVPRTVLDTLGFKAQKALCELTNELQLAEPSNHSYQIDDDVKQFFISKKYLFIFGDSATYDPGYLYINLKPKKEYIPFLLLPQDDSITRAINVLDRTPVLDFHKVGVVYVGPNQTSEIEILANQQGSKSYDEFLQGLGDEVNLLNCSGTYTGGLDTSSGLDGTMTYAWLTNHTQLIYHVVTLMPNQAHDAQLAFKKRHIGNNFVTVVYNDSRLPYRFDTLPSQFNLVNLIVTPDCDNFVWVHAQLHPDLPELTPVLDPKFMGIESVATFIRQLALHLSSFAQIHINPKNSITHWAERLRQIKRIQSKILS